MAQFFVMTAAIVAGAYLSLKVYEHGQQSTRQANAKKAIAQLHEELKTNALKVGLSFDYHQVVRDSLESLLKNKGGIINKKNVKIWKGLMAPELHQEVYSSLVATGKLAGVPTPLLKNIMPVYNLQKQLVVLGSPAMDYWWKTELTNRPKATAQALVDLMADYCKIEKKLTALYQNIFDVLREKKRRKNKRLVK